MFRRNDKKYTLFRTDTKNFIPCSGQRGQKPYPVKHTSLYKPPPPPWLITQTKGQFPFLFHCKFNLIFKTYIFVPFPLKVPEIGIPHDQNVYVNFFLIKCLGYILSTFQTVGKQPISLNLIGLTDTHTANPSLGTHMVALQLQCT